MKAKIIIVVEIIVLLCAVAFAIKVLLEIPVKDTSMEDEDVAIIEIDDSMIPKGEGNNQHSTEKIKTNEPTLSDLKNIGFMVDDEISAIATPTPLPTPREPSYSGSTSNSTYGEYIDENSGDEDYSVTVSKAQKVFISDVSELTSIYPINKIDFILSDISNPLIERYGYDNYVYSLSNLKGKSSKKITFSLLAKDGKYYQVAITKDGSEYITDVKQKWGGHE